VSPRTLIVGAVPVVGAEEFYRALLGGADTVIACDAAGEWCLALGRTPDLVVGDFDSARPGAKERLEAAGVEVRSFPTAKDESDLDLALAAARERGTSGVILTAAFSERLDHSLAAIGTALRAADLNPVIEEPTFRAFLVDAADRPAVHWSAPAGTTVSVIALVSSSGVTLDGLVYPLTEARLPLLSSLGLSNIVDSGGVVGVTVAQGTVLVIASRGEVVSSPD